MLKRLLLYIVYQSIFSSLLFSNSILPANNSILNYVHVLFEWEQEPDAISYNLQSSNDSNFYNIVLDILESNESVTFEFPPSDFKNMNEKFNYLIINNFNKFRG